MRYIKKFIPKKPQQWFAIIAILFGGLFAIITPAYQGGDEIYHFTRAFQIAEGQFAPQKTMHGTGGEIPVSIFKSAEYINKNHKNLSHFKASIVHFPLKPKERTFASFPHTSVGNPLMYAPQAIAIRLGLTFEAPPVILMLLARLANLAFYVGALYIAIRLLPSGKTAAMVIALMPANIVAASSGSADTFTIVAMALFVASILYLRARTTPLSLKGRLGLLGLVAAISLAKLPLQIFLLLGFLIPVRVLGGTRAKWLAFLLLAAVLAIGVGGTWVWITLATTTPYGPPGVMVADQVSFMSDNPLHFLGATLNTYFSNISINMVHAYSFAIPPAPYAFPMWAAVVYSIFLSRFFPVSAGKHTFKSWEKWFVGALGGLFMIGIGALLYISWTPVGHTSVDGIHPRYLAPLLFLLIPLCAIARPRVLTRFSRICAIVLPVCFLLLATFLLLQGFYL